MNKIKIRHKYVAINNRYEFFVDGYHLKKMQNNVFMQDRIFSALDSETLLSSLFNFNVKH